MYVKKWISPLKLKCLKFTSEFLYIVYTMIS